MSVKLSFTLFFYSFLRRKINEFGKFMMSHKYHTGIASVVDADQYVLDLPDPDPLCLDPDPSINKQKSEKNVDFMTL